MPWATRAGYAAKRAQLFMDRTCTITRFDGMELVYTGKCRLEAAPANQGQLSESDPTEASESDYETWNVFLIYPDASGLVLPGDFLRSVDPQLGSILELSISSVEDIRSNQMDVQLEGIKQRTGSPRIMVVLYRTNPETGVEVTLPAQVAQLTLEGPIPLGASPDPSGGQASYIGGMLIFPDRNADVMGGDRFKYQGRYGEVTSVPIRAPDRTEVRIRLEIGGA